MVLNRLEREAILFGGRKAADRLMRLLLERYNSPEGTYALHSPVFTWTSDEALDKGVLRHWSLCSDGLDQAHAVLARDEWGIVWC